MFLRFRLFNGKSIFNAFRHFYYEETADCPLLQNFFDCLEKWQEQNHGGMSPFQVSSCETIDRRDSSWISIQLLMHLPHDQYMEARLSSLCRGNDCQKLPKLQNKVAAERSLRGPKWFRTGSLDSGLFLPVSRLFEKATGSTMLTMSACLRIHPIKKDSNATASSRYYLTATITVQRRNHDSHIP